jgi:D-alanyl-D-alanine carboxypeptidase
MNIFKKIITLNLFLWLLLTAFSCEKIVENVPQATCTKGIANHPNAARYKKMVDEIIKKGAPGISMTVISPQGTWSGTGGMADLKNKVKMTPCHILRLGSVSKIFCAATIMKLQDEGKLNINDMASKYVPKAIIDKIPNGNLVTIKQLLSHQTGIPEYSNINNILQILNLTLAKQSAEQNLNSISNKKATSKAGTELLYSNSNYLLLSVIIKNVTGKPANESVKDILLKPLELNNIYTSNEQPSNQTRGYFDVNDNGLMLDHTEIDNNAVGGADMLDGGVLANSNDLALFFNALISGKILSASSLSQMHAFNKITQDLGDLTFIKEYGLGLMKLETDHGSAIGHYGTVHCFNSMVYYFPEQRVTVALIRNGDSAKIKKFIETKEIFNYLFEDK